MNHNDRCAFSLVEVVLALGVIGFAIVAIIGVIPIGLHTSHSSQDETRAAQVAQAIFSSLASQTQTQFNNVQLQRNDNSTAVFDLTQSSTATLYVDNDGKLIQTASAAVYSINVTTNSSPAGFDAGYANEVTLAVAWPASAPAANQTKRDFTRILSKY